MRLRKPIIAVAAVGALTLTACGGGGSSSGGDNDNVDKDAIAKGGETGESTNPDAEGPVEIDGAKEGGTVTVLSYAGLNTMDPTEAYYQNTTSILTGLVTRSLTQYVYDPEQKSMVLVPDLATDLGTPNDDYTEWTFTLRDGITYEDGTPVEPEDFVWSAARSMDRDAFPEGPAYSNEYFEGGDSYQGPYTGNGLKGFTAVTVQGNELTYHMAKPFPDMPYWGTFAALGPIPEQGSDPETYLQHPLATGPYMFDSYTPEKQLTLVRNPNWDPATDPGRTQYPEEYDMTFNAETAQIDQIMKSDSGEGQTTMTFDDLLAQDFSAVNQDGRTSVGSYPLTSYWAPDYTKITDLAVRQALLWAYPYEGAAAAAGYIPDITSLPASSLMPPGTAGQQDYEAVEGHQPGQTDAGKAKSLLEESGNLGYEISWLYAKDDPEAVAAKNVVEDALQEAGFTTDPKPTTTADFSTLRDATDTDINVRSGGWIADWPSGASWFPPLLKTNPSKTSTGQNYSRFSEPEVDDRIQEILAAPLEDQPGMWGDLDQEIAEKYLPLIPTRYGGVAQAHGSKIEGHFIDNTIGMPTWKSIWVNQ